MVKPATCSLRSQYSAAADAVQMFDFLAHVHNCLSVHGQGLCLVVLVVTDRIAGWLLISNACDLDPDTRKRARTRTRTGGSCVHMFGLVKMSC